MYILHLSDLLFGTKDDASRWYKQLTSDLYEKFKCDCLDALIISGDIAKNSTPEEYEAAKEFIINLMIHFRLRWSEVVIVPGNHDLNFKKAQDAYELIRSEDYSGPRDESHIIDRGESVEVLDPEKYRQRFIHFSSFCRPFLERPYPLEPELQYTLHYFKNQKLLVLGLNSAWQLDHHYKFRAGINSDALGNAIRKINDNDKYKESRLKIAVWHHPLYGNSQDRIKDWHFMKQLERNGFRLILHGHIHQARPDDFHHFDEPAWGQIETIAAGTFGVPMRNSDVERNYTLEYHVMNWEAKILTVCSHTRLQANEDWQENIIFPKEKSSEERSHCYEIEQIINQESTQGGPSFKIHKENLIKAIIEGSIVPILGAGINLCGRKRKDTNPLNWQVDGPYPPTNCELAAYINQKSHRGSEEKIFLDKVIDLLISDTLMGELPKGLTRNKLQTIASFSNLEPHRVSQYVLQTPSKRLIDDINYIYTGRLYEANSLHKFIVNLIKNACPSDPSDVNGEKNGATSYPLIVNTCFDRTLENLFKHENLPFDLISYTSSEKKFIYQQFNFDKSNNQKDIIKQEDIIEQEDIAKKGKDNFVDLLTERPVILRIYGPVDFHNDSDSGENFALSEDHFIDYLAHDIAHQLPDCLQNKLKDSHLWFLGYNLSYWYLRFIIRQIIQDKRNPKESEELKEKNKKPEKYKWWAVREKSDSLNEYLWDKNGVRFFAGQTIGSWQKYSQELEQLLSEQLSKTPKKR